MYTDKCPYCGATVECKDSAIIYGRSYGMIWICTNYPNCDAYVGCHGSGKNPLGRLANAELREWKKKAHAAFDPIWKSKRKSRHGAYKWLSERLNIEPAHCHIGMFDVEQCKQVIKACNVN